MVDETAGFYREKLHCAAFPNPAVQNWIGQITDISTASTGYLALTIALDAHTAVDTGWNAARNLTKVSNPGVPRILLEPSELAKGQWVRFSGSFVKAQRNCFSEKSLTLSGSIQKPEFAFQFSEISPIF